MKKWMVLLVVFATALLPVASVIAKGSGGNLYDLTNHHADEGVAINSQNVNQLRPAWHINTTELVSHAPLVQNGVVYFADWGGDVYAAKAGSGKIIWQKHLEDPNTQWAWHGFAGTGALVDGMLLEASVEGNAFAIDVKTGDVIWETQFTDQPTAGNLGALLTYSGLVYIGIQSVDEALAAANPGYVPSARGGVVALDLKTGEEVWKFYTVPEYANGAAVWSSFALNPALDALFFTTGNNYTPPATDMSDSIVSVNAHTGDLLWYTQLTEGDVWIPPQPLGPDWDFGAGAQLFSAMIDGQERQLVGAGQKSGEYIVLDQETGEMVWHTQVGLGGVGGGMRGEASISHSTIFAWSNNNWNDVPAPDPATQPINVKAMNPADGSVIWADESVQPAMGTSAGFLAKDVYFVGSLDGTINAYGASDGKVLWSAQTPSSVSSSLNVVGNTLYVGVGVPGVFGGDPADPNGLYTFSIGHLGDKGNAKGGDH
jgi:polyvinyl alcohol dehydrogenase (cytochrome)